MTIFSPLLASTISYPISKSHYTKRLIYDCNLWMWETHTKHFLLSANPDLKSWRTLEEGRVSFASKPRCQAHKQRRRINLSTGHKDAQETRVRGPESHKVYIISYYKYDKSDPTAICCPATPPPHDHPLEQPIRNLGLPFTAGSPNLRARIYCPCSAMRTGKCDLEAGSATSGGSEKYL